MTDVHRSDNIAGVQNGHSSDDLFSNFSLVPPKLPSRLRQFTRRSKYRIMAEMRGSRGPVGSNSNLGSLSGSRSRLDASRLMSLQEDAHSRRISSEVMKKRLYESVVTTSPRHRYRRFSMHTDHYNNRPDGWDSGLAYAIQSLPVTPAHSRPHSPCRSPEGSSQFVYGFYSRGATPHGATPSDEDMKEMDEEEEEGLASLFSPRPRYIPAMGGVANELDTGLVLGPPPSFADRLADSLAAETAQEEEEDASQ